MRIRSVKFNFIMNAILTASTILFPLITFPYVSRILLVEGNGKVAFASSVLTYFTMFASLGIPTYGIRACARVRDDKENLSKTVQELFIINMFTMLITFGVFLIALVCVPKFAAEKELLLINSISMVLNVFGVSWLYSALEQYAYITVCSIVFKAISVVMMFLWVKNPDDYIMYGAITVFAASGSYVMNFIRLRRFVTLKKVQKYDFKQHVKPIVVFFAMSAAISVYTNLDVVMLGFMSGDKEVGYYNAAIKVKTILVSMITSLGTVLLPRLSYYVQQKEQEAFYRTIVKAFNFVVLSAGSVMIYFVFLSKESILFLAGEAFLGAVIPMVILMPTVLFIGVSNITGIQMLTPLGEEKKVLVSIVGGAILDFVLNLTLIPRYGASGASFATAMAELLVVVVQVYYLRDIWKRIAGGVSIGKCLIALLCASAGVIFLKQAASLTPFFMLCTTAVAFFGIYGAALLLLKEKFVWGIVDSIRMRRL